MNFDDENSWYTADGIVFSDETFDTAQVYIEKGVAAYAEANGLNPNGYFGIIAEDDSSRAASINGTPVEIGIVDKSTRVEVATVTIKVKHDNEVIIV